MLSKQIKLQPFSRAAKIAALLIACFLSACTTAGRGFTTTAFTVPMERTEADLFETLDIIGVREVRYSPTGPTPSIHTTDPIAAGSIPVGTEFIVPVLHGFDLSKRRDASRTRNTIAFLGMSASVSRIAAPDPTGGDRGRPGQTATVDFLGLLGAGIRGEDFRALHNYTLLFLRRANGATTPTFGVEPDRFRIIWQTTSFFRASGIPRVHHEREDISLPPETDLTVAALKGWLLGFGTPTRPFAPRLLEPGEPDDHWFHEIGIEIGGAAFFVSNLTGDVDTDQRYAAADIEVLALAQVPPGGEVTVPSLEIHGMSSRQTTLNMDPGSRLAQETVEVVAPVETETVIPLVQGWVLSRGSIIPLDGELRLLATDGKIGVAQVSVLVDRIRLSPDGSSKIVTLTITFRYNDRLADHPWGGWVDYTLLYTSVMAPY